MIIYKATNKINNKSYIGQTIKSLRSRKSQHLADSIRKNYNFHKAIQKYGIDSFSWEILCECDSKEEMDEMEFHYIIQYDTYRNGYNCTFGGEGSHGHKHSEEWIDHMKNDNPMFNEDVVNKVKNTIKNNGHHFQDRTWDDIHGEEKTKTMKENQSNLMSSKNPMFNEDVIRRMINTKRIKGSYHTKKAVEGRKTAADKLSKDYIVTTPNGDEIEVHGLNGYCKQNNLSTSCMIGVANGDRKQHKGYKCRRRV